MIYKKGFMFTADAIIALVVVFLIILVVLPPRSSTSKEMVVQDDLLKVLSAIKISEINNTYVDLLKSQGKITQPNQTVLEQIGEFYAKNMPEAGLLASALLTDISPDQNIGLWFDDQLVASSNSTSYESAENIWTSRQMISGIEEGLAVKGYSSRAFLSKLDQTKYFYFGGYAGDGNISVQINYTGNISSAEMEIAINENFSLYVNGNYTQNYSKSDSDVVPKTYNISISNFHSGTNRLDFKSKNPLYIAGGYVKITYESGDEYEISNRYYFPGIKGVINLYDGFYSRNISSMSIFLHFNSSQEVFLNIGNITIMNMSTNGEINMTINDSEIKSKLNYTAIAQQTVPLRFGVKEILASSLKGNADVVIITDLSQTMNHSLSSNATGIRRDCSDPLLYDSTTARISLARCLDQEFAEIILNASGNRVSLVAVFGDRTTPTKGRVNRTDTFISNISDVKRIVGNYNGTLYADSSDDPLLTPVGGSCICCALNSAYKILDTYSNKSTRTQFVISMSDGMPIYRCTTSGSEPAAYQGTRTGWPNSDAGPTSSASGCSNEQEAVSQCNISLASNKCSYAIQNANWSACRLNKDSSNKVNATVFSVGFGPVDECEWAVKTLQSVATCGGGTFYASRNASLLKQFYQSVAQSILELSYSEQISNLTGNFSSEIYPDSYIEFNYTSEPIPYGIMLTLEQKFNNATGSFTVPSGSQLLDAKVTSYSGSKWTKQVEIANQTSLWTVTFNLSSWGNDYTRLGDPYVINLPLSRITPGDNKVNVTLGSSPSTSQNNASNNKIIYTLLSSFNGYSPIVASAIGCKWNLSFEDGSSSTITVPLGYAGNQTCNYALGAYNQNDAVSLATYSLLTKLDLDGDGNIEVKLNDQDLSISSSEITGIPFTYETEVNTRTWQ